MPPPIPLPLRQQIWVRHRQGQDATTIARALRLRPRTVQQFVRRLQARGEAGLQTTYRAPTPRAPAPEPVRPEALFLHQEHPTWGAGFIRVRLQARHPSLPLPSERTLQRWFQQTRAPAAPPGRKPAREHQRARGPHAVWQVDAAEHIGLASGQTVSWLRGVDEFTGAVLGTRVFPPRALESSAGLRHAALFAAAVPPLGPAGGRAGGQRHALGQLERLAGGLGPVADRPGRPRVLERPRLPAAERQGGALARHRQALGRAAALRGRGHLATPPRRRGPRAARVLPGGRRAEPPGAFPDLRHSGRTYSRAWERAHWSFPRVTEYLHEFVVPRRVRPSGAVSVYEQDYRVGSAYRGQTLLVQFDPGDNTWVLCDARGQQLRRHPAREITPERVVKLKLELRHDR